MSHNHLVPERATNVPNISFFPSGFLHRKCNQYLGLYYALLNLFDLKKIERSLFFVTLNKLNYQKNKV